MRIPVLHSFDPWVKIGSLPLDWCVTWRTGDFIRFICEDQHVFSVAPIKGAVPPTLQSRIKEFRLETLVYPDRSSGVLILTSEPVEYFRDIIGFREYK